MMASSDLTAAWGAGSMGRQSGCFWGAEHPLGEFGPVPWVVAAAVPAGERLCCALWAKDQAGEWAWLPSDESTGAFCPTSGRLKCGSRRCRTCQCDTAGPGGTAVAIDGCQRGSRDSWVSCYWLTCQRELGASAVWSLCRSKEVVFSLFLYFLGIHNRAGVLAVGEGGEKWLPWVRARRELPDVCVTPRGSSCTAERGCHLPGDTPGTSLGGHGAWGELFWGGWGGHSGYQGGCWHLPHWYGSRNELGLNLGRVNRVLMPTAQLVGCWPQSIWARLFRASAAITGRAAGRTSKNIFQMEVETVVAVNFNVLTSGGPKWARGIN